MVPIDIGCDMTNVGIRKIASSAKAILGLEVADKLSLMEIKMRTAKNGTLGNTRNYGK